jgi:tryptophan synthase alpha chain
MSYYNPLYRYGLKRLVADAAAAGVDGLIVPDLPFEEAAGLRQLAAGKLAVVPLAAPTTPLERLEKIVAAGSGFLYYVSVTGITGARNKLPADLAAALAKVGEKSAGRLPLAVGFGISTPQQAQTVAARADAVIVGSALVRIIAEHGASEKGLAELESRVADLKAALER